MPTKIRDLLSGFTSVLDIMPSTDVKALAIEPAKTDEEAIRDDWVMVGNDLRYSMSEHRDSQEE